MFRRLWEKIKRLWQLAKSERATPREIGWAVAIGAFAGCTPALGVHGWVAIGLATLARKNRLFAWLGSRVSNWVMLPFIILTEVQLSHRVRTGVFLDIDAHSVIDQAPSLLLDWCLGTLPVATVMGVLTGAAAYGLAHRRDKRKRLAEAITPPSPAELPPPSSGSPA